MPRQLQEIKNFSLGTIFNTSETDIPADASAYALNIDAMAEDGILKGIKNDAFFMSSNQLISTVSRGIRWAPYHIDDSTKKGTSFHVERSLKTGSSDYLNTAPNNDDVCIDDISLFNNKGMCKIGYIGTKGVKETVIADKIQPYYEVLLNSSDLYATGLYFDGGDSATINETATNIQYGTGGINPNQYGLQHLLFRKLFDSSGTETGTPHELANYNEINWMCADSVSDNEQIYVQSIRTHNPAATILKTDTTIPFRTKVVTVGSTSTSTSYVTRSGDIGDSQFTMASDNEGEFTLVFVSDNSSGDYDDGNNDYLTICSPDGHTIKYVIDEDVTTTKLESGSAGNQIVNIGLSGVTGQANVAAEFKAAIEGFTGHLGRVSIETSTTTVTNDTLTVTFNIETLGNVLKEGDYFSLTGANDSDLSGEYNIDSDEIIYVESVDNVNHELIVKRGVFGKAVKEYVNSSSTYTRRDYVIYANRMTISGEGDAGKQLTTFKASARFTNFSNRSGNHIGWSAKSHSLGGVASLTPNGRFYTSGDTVSLVFDATAKTLTLGTAIKVNAVAYGNFNIEEGDWIYYCAQQDPTGDVNIPAANNGFHAQVLKKEIVDGKIVLTFDKSPVSGTYNNDNLISYLDTSLIINGSFLFENPTANSSGAQDIDVDSNTEYKANEWKHVEYVESSSAYVQNKYGYSASLTDDNNISKTTSAESNKDRSDKRWFSVLTNGENLNWPYSAAGMEILAEYQTPAISNTSYETKLQVALIASSTDTVLNLKSPVESVLAVNDIIRYDSEYMRVNTINGSQITVERGYLESTIATHNVDVEAKKCSNVGIQQTIPKYKLKGGQSYRIILYAKSDDHATDYAYGALSLRINGGYIKPNGEWTAASTDPQKGYNVNKTEVMQEERWINFNELTLINNDTALITGTTNPHPAALDDIWRKYVLTFHMPKGQELSTDLILDIANRGVDNKLLYIDSVELIENTILYNLDDSSLLKATNYIDNSGVKDMVTYDSVKSKLAVSKAVHTKLYEDKELLYDWVRSPFASKNIHSSLKDATIVSNNRETHIGFGGGKEDTSPQWLGYVNHTFFGKDYSQELYQDEDTVHTYDEEGTSTLSKVVVAGEFERVTATLSGFTLTVTFTHDGYLNDGDNIVIREWMDADNSWDGNGVWVVTDTSSANQFQCRRINTLDKATPVVTNTDGGTGPQDDLISFRPYFYYGIKAGEPYLYRIFPDTLYTDATTISTEYTKGKIEKSLDLTIPVTSVTTFYNKGQGGATPGMESAQNGGGCLYLLSDISDEVFVVNVMKKYDAWTTEKLIQPSSIDLKFKSFKWSNDHINGNVDGTKEVFGGLAGESSPSISYAGKLSDILETKAPNHTHVAEQTTANSDQITTSMFDTRLWVQTAPNSGGDGFTEGDRFLFAARTQTSNTNGPDVFYCADRTPPTSIVTKSWSRVSTGGRKFNAGPGMNPTETNRSYFYHYYDDKDSKHKLGRVSAVDKPGSNNNGTGTWLNTSTSDRPYINFGFNVGWDDDILPSILVAKYGLFQLADNDGDGVIDGTGLVVPSTTSITDTDDDYKTGPYGRLHQRVCGHAVGLIGGSTSGSWWRHWGRKHGRMNKSGDDYYITRWGQSDNPEAAAAGPIEDMPEKMAVDKLIFTSSDIHYGDYQPKQEYAFTGRTDIGSCKSTDLTISHSTYDLTTLEVGDPVVIVTDTSWARAATITLIQVENNLVRVNIPTHAVGDDTGKLYPYGIWETLAWGRGGIIDDEAMFHFSYNIDNPDDGNIFTQGEGSGHYTRTFMTPPTYFGGPREYHSDYDHYKPLPGIVWNIEKLNYRAGIMMRPFLMEDDDFNDLIIGNGIYVDLPSWPNNILHFDAGGKIHQGTSSYNANSSRLFITCPIPADDELKSKVYQCDLQLMYPSQDAQIEVFDDANVGGTNYWNENDSWDVAFAGEVHDYHTTDQATLSATAGYIDEAVTASGATKDVEVDDGSGGISGLTDLATSSAIFNNERIYKSDGTFIGRCQKVQRVDPSGSPAFIDLRFNGSEDVYGNDGLENNVSDGDRLYVSRDILGSGANHPIVEIDVTTLTGPNTNLFGASGESRSYYRYLRNALVGMCISIKDASTGLIQTRQIISSETAGMNYNDKMYLQVHYPFSHAPVDGDKFWVWKHSSVCTAPVRLWKTHTLPYNLGDIASSIPYLGVHAVYKNTGDISIANSTAVCTTGAHHNLSTNDKIRLKDMSTASYNDGIHKITVTGPDTFTAQNSTITNSSGSAITGTWELLNDSDSSAANPLTVTLNRPLISASFGGLDMRKTKSYIGRDGNPGIDNTVSSGEARYFAEANTLASDGEMVTINATVGEFDGTYYIKDTTGVQFDFLNTHNADDNANDIPVYTNQYEMLIAGTASKAEVGELRAGLSQWDKGNIASNIQRYDSTEDADRFMNFGESSVEITPVSLANQPGDYFNKNNRYYYKISFIYDGYQEGPLSGSYWSHYDTSSRGKLTVKVKLKKSSISRRLSHICVYRKDTLNDLYKLVEEVSTESGWSDEGDNYSYLLADEGIAGASYEARTGTSEVLDVIKVKYGISAEIDGYLFVGDCSHSKIKNASNQIFRSKAGQFSIFDYANDFLVLKSKPKAMVNFIGRLFVFDETNIYKINPQNLAIEDTFEGIGCCGKDSVIVTEYGMFFADKNGAYMHNGQSPIKISEPIQQGGDTDVSFGGTDNVKDLSWNNTVTKVSGSSPYVMYDAASNSVLFNIEHVSKESLSTANSIEISVKYQYLWSYNIAKKSWDLFELSKDSKIGKPFYGNEGEVFIPVDNCIFEHKGGSSERDYTWISKKLSMGEDSIMKVFNKIKLNGISNDIKRGGVYHESSDRILVATSSGNVNTDDLTLFERDTGNIDYRLKGSNKKGRWVQFKLENMTESLDSFGLIFRRKSTK